MAGLEGSKHCPLKRQGQWTGPMGTINAKEWDEEEETTKGRIRYVAPRDMRGETQKPLTVRSAQIRASIAVWEASLAGSDRRELGGAPREAHGHPRGKPSGIGHGPSGTAACEARTERDQRGTSRPRWTPIGAAGAGSDLAEAGLHKAIEVPPHGLGTARYQM